MFWPQRVSQGFALHKKENLYIQFHISHFSTQLFFACLVFWLGKGKGCVNDFKKKIENCGFKVIIDLFEEK